jgi:1-acyl-sn-glycerol-3-phosphate acyltransferase
VAWLALRAQVPVYPVFIHDSRGGQHILEPFLRPARVRLTYGEPIDLSAFYSRKCTHAILKQATDEIMRKLAELGGIAFSETQLEEQKVTIPIRPAAG